MGVRFLMMAPVMALAISACAVGPKAASLNVEHQIVYVDRPVAAVKAGDVPVPVCKSAPTPKETLAKCLGPRPADARQALDQALAKLLELIGYIDVADPLLVSAAKQP